MADNTLDKILEELQKLNQSISSNADAQARNNEVEKIREKKEVTREATKIGKDSKLSKAAGAFQSGNLATMTKTGGSMLGGPAGAALGAVAGASYMFGPRGYNAFNIFEKFDRTRVQPFQQVSDIAYQYGRHGKQLSDEQIMKLYQGGVQSEQRGFAEVERVRKMISTSVMTPLLQKIGLGGVGEFIEGTIESAGSSSKNWMSPDVNSNPQEKTANVQVQARKMQKSIARQDKFDDNY